MPGIEINPASALAPHPEPRVVRPEHAENSLTRILEQQAAKIPSDVFLAVSLSAMAAALILEAKDNQRASRFVGMWVAPLLVMGVYIKLVKVLGSS